MVGPHDGLVSGAAFGLCACRRGGPDGSQRDQVPGGDRVRGPGETVNGALSLTYFLREYSFGVLRWPAFLLSDYVYLVPRILLPMKDSMILSP